MPDTDLITSVAQIGQALSLARTMFPQNPQRGKSTSGPIIMEPEPGATAGMITGSVRDSTSRLLGLTLVFYVDYCSAL